MWIVNKFIIVEGNVYQVKDTKFPINVGFSDTFSCSFIYLFIYLFILWFSLGRGKSYITQIEN